MAAAHAHAWVIDSPNGPVSVGRCGCGAVREFSNVFDDKLPGRSWNSMGGARTSEQDRDRVRRATVKGDAHGSSKLTEQGVLDIRRRYAAGESGAVLAREYGVSDGTVLRAARGESWTHLPMPERGN